MSDFVRQEWGPHSPAKGTGRPQLFSLTLTLSDFFVGTDFAEDPYMTNPSAAQRNVYVMTVALLTGCTAQLQGGDAPGEITLISGENDQCMPLVRTTVRNPSDRDSLETPETTIGPPTGPTIYWGFGGQFDYPLVSVANLDSGLAWERTAQGWRRQAFTSEGTATFGGSVGLGASVGTFVVYAAHGLSVNGTPIGLSGESGDIVEIPIEGPSAGERELVQMLNRRATISATSNMTLYVEVYQDGWNQVDSRGRPIYHLRPVGFKVFGGVSVGTSAIEVPRQCVGFERRQVQGLSQQMQNQRTYLGALRQMIAGALRGAQRILGSEGTVSAPGAEPVLPPSSTGPATSPSGGEIYNIDTSGGGGGGSVQFCSTDCVGTPENPYAYCERVCWDSGSQETTRTPIR